MKVITEKLTEWENRIRKELYNFPLDIEESLKRDYIGAFRIQLSNGKEILVRLCLVGSETYVLLQGMGEFATIDLVAFPYSLSHFFTADKYLYKILGRELKKSNIDYNKAFKEWPSQSIPIKNDGCYLVAGGYFNYRKAVFYGKSYNYGNEIAGFLCNDIANWLVATVKEKAAEKNMEGKIQQYLSRLENFLILKP